MASTWSRIFEEFNVERQRPGPVAFWARILTRKIQPIIELTKRPLIIYGSACTSSGKKYSAAHLQIDQSDMIGFQSVMEGLEGPNLDIVIHSPGGFPEATESIVESIRRRFSNVRFIVPAYAKSAATMMVLSGDEILLDEDAELGPIDPQMLTPNGLSPAEAIKEQFLKASDEISKDPQKLSIWVPILQPMGPALLVRCDNAIELSKQLVIDWLTKYMFRGAQDGAERARNVADYLSSHQLFKSHARRVKLVHLKREDFGLNIRNLRDDGDLFPKIWELYCAMDVIFSNTTIYKLFYNSAAEAMVRATSQAPTLQLVGEQVPAVPQGSESPPR